MPRQEPLGQLDAPIGEAVDVVFSKINARMRPDQIQQGEVAVSENGRMDVDGAWQTRKGVNNFAGALSTADEELILPFYLYANVAISAASRVAALVTVTTSGVHNFNDATVVGIANLTGSVSPNGNRLITVTSTTQFTFSIAGATGSETYGTGSSPTAGAPFLSDLITQAYGSSLYSDPSSNNAEYIIVALNTNAVAINLNTTASVVISYPAGLTVNNSVEVLQAFNKVYIFNDGVTSWEWDGDLSGGLAFTKVANGSYAQPKVFTSSSNTSASQGVVTVTETAHGLSVGDSIMIFDAKSTSLIEQLFFTVATVPGTGSFTFFADTDDFSSTSVVLGQAQSEGLGFTHMPAPAWAAYHQRRLICPYNFTTTGTSGSEVITDRNVKDEIIFSDILDSDTFDQLQNSFKVTGGTADYIQTVHPFADDQAVAMSRNSLHLITGISGALNNITIKEITREAGLVARKSVVTVKNSIFFLSDNGVYALDFQDRYNLRGAGLPLSDPIDPIIKRINSDYAHNAVGIYHDNRYWLAVPLDDSTVNNSMIVYNTLNSGWESIDTINLEGWNVTNLIKAGAGGIDKLYAVSSNGGIHVIDDREDDVDYLAVVPGIPPASYAIASSVTTRGFTLSSIGRKRYSAIELHAESTSTNASNATIAGIAENLDSDFTIGTVSGFLGEVLPVGEDASIRARIGGKRAYSLQIKITPTQGRPKIRAIKIEGTKAFQSLNQAS